MRHHRQRDEELQHLKPGLFRPWSREKEQFVTHLFRFEGVDWHHETEVLNAPVTSRVMLVKGRRPTT